jgi:hypothetical protein
VGAVTTSHGVVVLLSARPQALTQNRRAVWPAPVRPILVGFARILALSVPRRTGRLPFGQ